MKSHHEDFQSRVEPARSSERGFGIVMALALTALAWWKAEEWAPVVGWMVGIAVVFGVTALLVPRVLRPLNSAWTRLGILLGRVITPVVLFLLFVLAFVPLGFLLRLRGFRPLRLEFTPGDATYWIDRDPPGPEPETMERQF